jgi:hypothetical protein
LLTACTSGGKPAVRPDVPGPLDALNTAVKSVGGQRTALLADLEAVGRAATALDQTDTVCLKGDGPPARTSLRKAAPLAGAVPGVLGRLPGELTSYRSALVALSGASKAVSGDARAALTAVVATGQGEAAAVEAFRVAAVSVWPSYRRLAGQEGLWVKRAVTPWYRSAQEGSAAYSVLVERDRDALNGARMRLGTATNAVGRAIDAQAARLTAADASLASVRAKG